MVALFSRTFYSFARAFQNCYWAILNFIYFFKKTFFCTLICITRGLHRMGKRHQSAVRFHHLGSIGCNLNGQSGPCWASARVMTPKRGGARLAWHAAVTGVSNGVKNRFVDRTGPADRFSRPIKDSLRAVAGAGCACRPTAVFSAMEQLQTFPPKSR